MYLWNETNGLHLEQSFQSSFAASIRLATPSSTSWPRPGSANAAGRGFPDCSDYPAKESWWAVAPQKAAYPQTGRRSAHRWRRWIRQSIRCSAVAAGSREFGWGGPGVQSTFVQVLNKGIAAVVEGLDRSGWSCMRRQLLLMRVACGMALEWLTASSDWMERLGWAIVRWWSAHNLSGLGLGWRWLQMQKEVTF